MSKFLALISHPSLEAGKAEGSIEIQSGGIVLRTGEREVTFPFSNLELTRGGANNALIFFRHPAHEEWSCYTRDRRILRLLRGTPASEQAKNLESQRRRSVLEWGLFLVITSLVVFGLWKSKEPLVEAATYFVPKKWETSAGGVIYTSLATSSNIIEDEKLDSKFREMVKPLLEVVADSGYDFKFHLADEKELNAFALPGGHVVVHSSVILKAKRVEEVLGVLAHEIAHVTHRHTVKQLFSVLGLYFVFDIVFGNVAGTLAALTQVAPYLLQQGFSRAYEDEADLDGFEYLLKANIDPGGMIDFFKRINEEEKVIPGLAEVEKHLTFLSTHPGTEDRLALLEQKAKAQSGKQYRNLTAGFREFQDALRTKIGESPDESDIKE